MSKLVEITQFLDSELNLGAFSDASNNGLQVEGCAEVVKVAVAVDCGLSVIQEALRRGAQLLFGGDLELSLTNRDDSSLLIEGFAPHLDTELTPVDTAASNMGNVLECA